MDGSFFNMIEVTLLNDRKMIINAELIEVVEQTPDTIITLTTERKIIVKESAQKIVSRVISYKRRLYKSNFIGSDLEDQAN